MEAASLSVIFGQLLALEGGLGGFEPPFHKTSLDEQKNTLIKCP